MDMTNILNKVGIPLAVIYLLLIVGFVLYFLRLYKVYLTKHWSSVTGIVDRIELIKKKRRTSSGVSVDIFDLNLKYKYKVDGKDYTGNRLRYFHATGTYKKHLEGYLKEFAKGSIVQVYHHPNKASESLLIPGIKKGA